MTGVMITCQRNQEARCTSEVSQLFDKVFEQRASFTTLLPVNSDKNSPLPVNFTDEIAKEVAMLKNPLTKPFQVVGTGDLSCIVLVKLSPSAGDPVELVGELFKKNDSGAENSAR